MSGTRRTMTSIRCPPACGAMYGEKPNSRPPTREPIREGTKRWMAMDAVHADRPRASVPSRLYENIGPSVSVTGVSRSAGSEIAVFHIRFTPFGALRNVEVSGLRPCVIAYGGHAVNQMNCSESPGYPTHTVFGWAHTPLK